jgi:hypothetical protein
MRQARHVAVSNGQRHALQGMISKPSCLQGVLKALNVNKLTRCGVTFKFWYVSDPIPRCDVCRLMLAP